MDLGWKILIPIGLVWAVVTAILVLVDDQAGMNGRLAPVVGTVLLVATLLVTPMLRRDPTRRTERATSTARQITPPDPNPTPTSGEVPV
jgi:NADH-quinone oxidoreductase subunit H